MHSSRMQNSNGIFELRYYYSYDIKDLIYNETNMVKVAEVIAKVFFQRNFDIEASILFKDGPKDVWNGISIVEAVFYVFVALFVTLFWHKLRSKSVKNLMNILSNSAITEFECNNCCRTDLLLCFLSWCYAKTPFGNEVSLVYTNENCIKTTYESISDDVSKLFCELLYLYFGCSCLTKNV